MGPKRTAAYPPSGTFLSQKSSISNCVPCPLVPPPPSLHITCVIVYLTILFHSADFCKSQGYLIYIIGVEFTYSKIYPSEHIVQWVLTNNYSEVAVTAIKGPSLPPVQNQPPTPLQLILSATSSPVPQILSSLLLALGVMQHMASVLGFPHLA